MQTLRIVITLSHLRALHDALRETFLKVTNNEILTAKRHRSQLKALWCLRRTEGEGGGGVDRISRNSVYSHFYTNP